MKQKLPFEMIVRQHGPTVWRVCRVVLGPGPDAEDAWAETFAAALTAWQGLPDDVNTEAWLVRVAHRKAVDVVRGASRRAVPIPEIPARTRENVPAGDSGSGPTADPADLAVLTERNSAVWHAVDALPERQRLAVAYHHLGGLSHDEVARLIGGSPAAVRRASSDGMHNLRKRFVDRDNHPRRTPNNTPEAPDGGTR